MSNAEKIIAQGDVETLVDRAKELGKELAAQRLTTSQIRNIFGEVRRIQMNWPASQPGANEPFRHVVLLQPKLAYQAKRAEVVERLRKELDPCIDEIRKAPKEKRRLYFQHFVDFFEAILAYHKAAGGN